MLRPTEPEEIQPEELPFEVMAYSQFPWYFHRVIDISDGQVDRPFEEPIKKERECLGEIEKPTIK